MPILLFLVNLNIKEVLYLSSFDTEKWFHSILETTVNYLSNYLTTLLQKLTKLN